MEKKFMFFLILIILVSLSNVNYAEEISNPLGRTNTAMAYRMAERDIYSKNNFVSVKLTMPIKNKNSINLYSQEGLSIYHKDSLWEAENLNTDHLNIKLSNGELIFSSGYEDFPIEDYDNIVIGSSNGYNSIVKVEDNKYRGYIYFKSNGNEIIPINYIDLEEYFYGVVPKEMPASFSIEALKAQAIAARTYTLHNINKHSREGFNLCDTTHCQVYGGMDGEYNSTNKAVNETKGMVIKYNGEIIDALYHSNSGGHTRDSKEVWGNDLPYLIGVEDKFSEGTTASTWSFSMSTSELSKKLINNGIDIGAVLNMEVIERTPSQRVAKIKVIGQNGEATLIESQIRQILGTNNLRTTWFSIEGNGEYSERSFWAIDNNSNLNIINLDNSYIIADNFKGRIFNRGKVNILNKDTINAIENEGICGSGDFLIQGKGFGHGVGMSQWGAKAMADAGYTYDEILKHYYTDVDIDLIY